VDYDDYRPIFFSPLVCLDRFYSYDTQAKAKLGWVTVLKESELCKIKVDRKRFSNVPFA
jgi:hypothetical protein